LSVQWDGARRSRELIHGCNQSIFRLAVGERDRSLQRRMKSVLSRIACEALPAFNLSLDAWGNASRCPE
jgi:hypothetical protein